MSAQNSRSSLLGAVVGTVAFSVVAGVLVTALVTPAIAVSGATVNSTIGIFESLPDFIEIDKQPQQNRIFATQKGKPVQIATVFNQNRQEVAFNEVSQFAKDAAVAGEDRRFYAHGGVDLAGVVRAAVKNVVGGGVKEGASTITQQLVKNIFIQQALEKPTQEEQDAAYEAAIDTSIERKLKEMKLAISLEKQYSKDEILLAYLNIAGFGGNTYGIQAAAERYYDTSAKDLTAAQAASLIAIVQEPGIRNLADPAYYANNKERRDVILRSMFAEKMIDQGQLDEALTTPVDDTTVKLSDPKNGCIAANQYARFFCDYVLRSVKDLESLGADEDERRANWKRGGYSIYTTLDLGLQARAQKISMANAPANETRMRLGSATVSVQVGTGKILIMTQNKKFNDSEKGGGRSATAINFATDFPYGGSTGFQPGSTYKIFTLLNWLENGRGINEIIDGSARTVDMIKFTDSCNGPYGGTYPFRNDEGEKGPMTVASGTARSVNGAFISMALQLDLCKIKETAESLDVHRADGKPLTTNPSSVLGTNEVAPLTMAAAYAGIASGGIFCKPIAVTKIIDPSGTELPGQAEDCQRRLTKDVAHTAAFAMAGSVNGGTASPSRTADGVPEIGKTGTTDSSLHTWMVGATTKVATAVWVGNISGKFPIRQYSTPAGVPGSLIRHYIWRLTMTEVNKKYRGGQFPAPAPELLKGSGKPLPDLRGETFESAKAQLEGLGFTVVKGDRIDSSQPENTVAKSNPVAGALYSPGGEVTLYLSRGNRSVVPDVVGDGTNTFDDAVAILNSAGFGSVTEKCRVLKPTEDPARNGFVAGSDPAAGKTTRASTTVTVTVTRVTC